MSEFNRDELEYFLAVVRKYMGLRNINQKSLSDMTNVGTSTMSRFLSMKTSDLNSQIIAKICAKLAIPKSEYVDFIAEEYWDEFSRLVDFYKGLTDEGKAEAKGVGDDKTVTQTVTRTQTQTQTQAQPVGDGGTAQKTTTARVKIGGKTTEIPFNAQGDYNSKINSLSYFHKKFIDDFLILDGEAKDMVAKVGDDLIDYFKTKGMIV